MTVEVLLSRLEKTRSTGPSRWLACCPAHPDKTPSMTVHETDDGRVLVHCFAGCSVESILNAAGLVFDALFPEKPSHLQKTVRRPFPASDVLAAITSEALIVATAAGNMGQGVALTDEDRKRLMIAAERINEARRIALGE